MGRFAKKDPVVVAQKQAANVIKAIQGKALQSVGTVRNYEEALSRVAQYANRELVIGLREITPAQAEQYLRERAPEVGQKTLDMERQAIQAMMHHVSRQLPEGQRLEVIKTTKENPAPLAEQARAYSSAQVNAIIERQTERNALSTAIAYATGLRSHELYTLQKSELRAPDLRPVHDSKFSGLDGQRYTVEGKGGLVREIVIPATLAERLEARRLDTPERITDRGIHYTQHYDIGAGKSWAKSFSEASERALGFTNGAHGLRHSYAQNRMIDTQKSGLNRTQAQLVTSQELGHFRPDITETYLR